MARSQARYATPTVVEILLNMRSAQDVERAVKATCLGGMAVGVIQVVSALWQFSAGGPTGETIFSLATALLVFGALIGVMRFSRLAAASLLAVFLATQLHLWFGTAEGGNVVYGIISVAFVFLFVRGVQATFVYHKLAHRFDEWQRTMDSSLDPRLFDEEN